MAQKSERRKQASGGAGRGESILHRVKSYNVTTELSLGETGRNLGEVKKLSGYIRDQEPGIAGTKRKSMMINHHPHFIMGGTSMLRTDMK